MGKTPRPSHPHTREFGAHTASVVWPTTHRHHHRFVRLVACFAAMGHSFMIHARIGGMCRCGCIYGYKTRVHESAKYVRLSGRTFSPKRRLSAILSAKWIAEMKSRRDFASKRILRGHFCEVDLRSFLPLPMDERPQRRAPKYGNCRRNWCWACEAPAHQPTWGWRHMGGRGQGGHHHWAGRNQSGFGATC